MGQCCEDVLQLLSLCHSWLCGTLALCLWAVWPDAGRDPTPSHFRPDTEGWRHPERTHIFGASSLSSLEVTSCGPASGSPVTSLLRELRGPGTQPACSLVICRNTQKEPLGLRAVGNDSIRSAPKHPPGLPGFTSHPLLQALHLAGVSP